MRSSLALGAACLIALAGCGGGGSHGSTVSPPVAKALGTLRINLSANVPANAGVHRQYLSPATQSVAMTFTPTGSTGGSPISINQNLAVASNPNCTVSLSAPTVCTISASLPAGTYTASFTTYDQPLTSGGAPPTPPANVLSANQSVPVTVVAGQATTLNVALGGVPASLVVAPVGGTLSGSGANFTLSNCFSNQSFELLALDAAQNVIIGPGAPGFQVTTGSALSVSGGAAQTPNLYTIVPTASIAGGSTATIGVATTSSQNTGAAPIVQSITITFANNVCSTVAPSPSPTPTAAPLTPYVSPTPAPTITPGQFSNGFTYYGGPVIPNVALQPIFWNSNVNSEIPARMPQFLSDLVSGPNSWYQVVQRYSPNGSAAIGLGSSAPGVTLNPSVCPASQATCSMTDAQIQAELQAQINARTLPQPDGKNTAFVLFIPYGVTITGPAGTSCRDFAAYTNTMTASISNAPLPYGIVMDTYPTTTGPVNNCVNGSFMTGRPFDDESAEASTAVADVITDPLLGYAAATPAFPIAWYNATANSTVGYYCARFPAGSQLDTFTTQNGLRTWTIATIPDPTMGSCRP